MKNSRSGEKIKLTSIDELLGVVNEESAMEIEIKAISPFKGHPFKVIADDKMEELINSVKESGVITPVLLRPAGENHYEMISGHRRMYAARKAGLSTVPAIVRDMTDQEYHRQAAMVVLDSYGGKVAECIHGFDKEVKQKIHEFVRTQHQDTPFYNSRRRLEPWQKFLINGLYERSMESGLEVNYDGIDGCVNHQKDHPGKALPEKKERGSHPNKRTSVIRKLREKQIAIARRSGKPIPKFLEQQIEREKSRR